MSALHIKIRVFLFLIISWGCLFYAHAATSTPSPITNTEEIKKPLYKPLVERYILDELKQLRQDQQSMKAEMIEKVCSAKLESSDRALQLFFL